MANADLPPNFPHGEKNKMAVTSCKEIGDKNMYGISFLISMIRAHSISHSSLYIPNWPLGPIPSNRLLSCYGRPICGHVQVSSDQHVSCNLLLYDRGPHILCCIYISSSILTFDACMLACLFICLCLPFLWLIAWLWMGKVRLMLLFRIANFELSI